MLAYDDYEKAYKDLQIWAGEYVKFFSDSTSDLREHMYLCVPEYVPYKERKKRNLWYLKWLLDHFCTYPIQEKKVDDRQFVIISKPLCRSPPKLII